MDRGLHSTDDYDVHSPAGRRHGRGRCNRRAGRLLHLIYAIRDTLNFFLGLSLNFSKIFPSPVSYFVSYFSVNIDTPSLIFSKYFGVP